MFGHHMFHNLGSVKDNHQQTEIQDCTIYKSMKWKTVMRTTVVISLQGTDGWTMDSLFGRDTSLFQWASTVRAADPQHHGCLHQRIFKRGTSRQIVTTQAMVGWFSVVNWWWHWLTKWTLTEYWLTKWTPTEYFFAATCPFLHKEVRLYKLSIARLRCYISWMEHLSWYKKKRNGASLDGTYCIATRLLHHRQHWIRRNWAAWENVQYENKH